MIHLTMNTGDVAVQTDQAPPGVTAVLRPLLGGGSLGLVARELSAYRVEVSRWSGHAIFSVWRGREGLVTCAVCWRSTSAAELWEAISRVHLAATDNAAGAMLGSNLPEQPQTYPWLAAVVLPALIQQPRDTSEWLGEFERCMAWLLMSE